MAKIVDKECSNFFCMETGVRVDPCRIHLIATPCFAAAEQDDVVVVDSEDEGTSGNANDGESRGRKRKLEKGCECTGAKRARAEQEQDDLMIVESEDEGASSSLGQEESRSHKRKLEEKGCECVGAKSVC